MLNNLTPEQLALAEQVADEYIRDLTAPTLPDGNAITRWLDIVYALYEKPRPERVEIVESPFAACALATELTGEKQDYTDYCGIGEGGWIAFYDYFQRIGILSADEIADLLALRDFSRVSWDSLLLDECAIVIQRPLALKLDDAGNLHCADGPCILWAGGTKDFSWHGTWVSERVIIAPRSHTKAEYLAITNTEQRRALSEAAGWQWVVEILGSSVVNTWTDPETSLTYDLLRCEDGVQLLVKQSPRLKDGSQPKYLEPVHEDLKTARAARKWQATVLTPGQCEADPHLSYGREV
jgi:hypothetical protein